jgi:hypothetical protein
VLGHLVSAVDVDGKLADVVQLLDEDAVTFEPLRGLDRAGDGTLDSVLDLAELIDEEIRCRSSPDADDGIVFDVLDCLAGDGLLQPVLSFHYPPGISHHLNCGDAGRPGHERAGSVGCPFSNDGTRLLDEGVNHGVSPVPPPHAELRRMVPEAAPLAALIVTPTATDAPGTRAAVVGETACRRPAPGTDSEIRVRRGHAVEIRR